MVDVRNLVIRVDVLGADTAQAAVTSLRTLIDSFNSSIVFSFDTSALDDARSAVSEIASDVTAPMEGSITFDSTDVENAQAALSDLWREEETVAESSSLLTDVWKGLQDAAKGISDGVTGAISSISAVKVAVGAAIGIGANEAFKVQRFDDAISEMFKGSEKEGVEKWLRSAPPGFSYDARAKAIIGMVQKGMKTGQAEGLQEAMENVQLAKAAAWATTSGNAGIEGLTSTLSRLSAMGKKQNVAKEGEAPGQSRMGRMLQPYGLSLPTKKENVKSVLLKLTMSKPIKLEVK